jgi:thymidylate synthase (FAD)
MQIKLVTHTPDPLTMIYAQARMTTTRGDFAEIYHNNATTERKIQLVRDTLNAGHWSVTRGVSFSFSITGISRACSMQLLRSVQGVSHEMQSQRYKKVDVGDDWYVIPPVLRPVWDKVMEVYINEELQTKPLGDEWTDLHVAAYRYLTTMSHLGDQYRTLIDLGIDKEDARMVLPNAARTNLVSTFSFEALKNFLGTRLCTRAQWEIRELAKLMRKEVLKVTPWAGPFLTIKCIPLGICTETNPAGCALLQEQGGKIEWRTGRHKEKNNHAGI